jgi:hypothetical protein
MKIKKREIKTMTINPVCKACIFDGEDAEPNYQIQ